MFRPKVPKMGIRSKLYGKKKVKLPIPIILRNPPAPKITIVVKL